MFPSHEAWALNAANLSDRHKQSQSACTAINPLLLLYEGISSYGQRRRWEQDRQCAYNVTMNHCCNGKEISITYFCVCMCVPVRVAFACSLSYTCSKNIYSVRRTSTLPIAMKSLLFRVNVFVLLQFPQSARNEQVFLKGEKTFVDACTVLPE